MPIESVEYDDEQVYRTKSGLCASLAAHTCALESGVRHCRKRTPQSAAAFANPPQMIVLPISVLGDHTMYVGSANDTVESARAPCRKLPRTAASTTLKRATILHASKLFLM